MACRSPKHSQSRRSNEPDGREMPTLNYFQPKIGFSRHSFPRPPAGGVCVTFCYSRNVFLFLACSASTSSLIAGAPPLPRAEEMSSCARVSSWVQWASIRSGVSAVQRSSRKSPEKRELAAWLSGVVVCCLASAGPSYPFPTSSLLHPQQQSCMQRLLRLPIC